MRSNDPFLAAVRDAVRSQRALAEKAFAQVDDDAFRRPLDRNTNSIAIVLKHLGGSLRSRFTDFLTTDGEKPDRNRDGEFVDDFAPGAAGRAQAIAAWDAGFAALERTIEELADADLARTVTIRGEPHTVPLALARALGHVSYHVGQVVLTSRLLATGEWKTLTIPRGESASFNRSMAATWTAPKA
jgi:uncharacterized damage-inducible protein DinB